MAGAAPARPGWRQRRQSLRDLGDRLRPTIDRVVVRNSTLPDRPVLDGAALLWIARLERHCEDVRDEVPRARGRTVPRLAARSWPHRGRPALKSFFLCAYGERIVHDCDEARRRAALVSEIPDLVSAFFAVLEVACHSPRHRGARRRLGTTHLALVAPRDGALCRMGARRAILRWTEGFDDTCPHEVRNESGDDRIVLMIRIRRPCRGLARLIGPCGTWSDPASSRTSGATSGAEPRP